MNTKWRLNWLRRGPTKVVVDVDILHDFQWKRAVHMELDPQLLPPEFDKVVFRRMLCSHLGFSAEMEEELRK